MAITGVASATTSWLRKALEEELDGERRNAMQQLLDIASKLVRQPRTPVLRQVARELEVRQKDRPMRELYGAVLARVEERAEEFRQAGQERLTKSTSRSRAVVSRRQWREAEQRCSTACCSSRRERT